MVDPIADMFTRIRNACIVKKETVVVPYSKIKMEIAKVLQKEKYLGEISRHGKKNRKYLDISLSYSDSGESAIKKIKRVSKPSRRIYVSFKELYSIGHGHAIRIVSTPNGILTDKDARQKKVGGEIIGEIW